MNIIKAFSQHFRVSEKENFLQKFKITYDILDSEIILYLSKLSSITQITCNIQYIVLSYPHISGHIIFTFLKK